MKKRFIRLSLVVFTFGITNLFYAQESKEIVNWYNGKGPGMETEKAYKMLKKRKSSTVVVAVIDSGVDIEHKDLQGKIWVNKDEIPKNGIDDDKNGYIDDVNGWSFLGNSKGENLNEANLEKTKPQTTSILGNLDVAKNNLNRLIKEGADKNSIAEATLNYKKALAEESSSLNREKFDFTKGVQLEKLANERVRLDQLRDRNDIYRQKVLQPAKVGDVKLNVVDDRLVKKFADDIANKQSISDAIGYEIGILEDPNVSEYVALNSARSIAKVLNSAEGKDAVGLEESKRLLSELDLFGVKRAIEGGKLFGADVDSFVEKIKIKKGELDGRVENNMGRVNEIYRKYGKPIPAGTSQTPSRGAMITVPAPQAMGSTNAVVSTPSFRTIEEAKAAGVQPGTRVIINGVQGTIK